MAYCRATTPQASGIIGLNNATYGKSDGMTWTAVADGWLTVTFNAATTTTGKIVFNVPVTYDASGVTN